MVVAAERKQDIIKDHARQSNDVGSPEVQIALLTERISTLTDHARTHQHDYASRRGLVMMVGKRNRLLRYLSRTRHQTYLDLIKRLGLRK